MESILIIFLIILMCGGTFLAYRLRKCKDIIQKKDEQIALISKECENAKTETKLKDMYLHNMSHEIRTPLNAVVGFAQLMAMPDELVSSEEKAEYTQHINQNANMLLMIIDDILNVSDIKCGKYKINKESNPLNNIATSSLACVKCRVNDNIELKFSSDFSDDYKLFTDVRRVQQILTNYLSNAIKHTKEGTIELHISKDENPGMVTFSVTDTGEGIPKEQAENIFERFTKLNDFVQGTGLGLNICHTLAKKLGGRVYLDTKYEGKGARFVFCHPIEDSL